MKELLDGLWHGVIDTLFDMLVEPYSDTWFKHEAAKMDRIMSKILHNQPA